MKRKIGIFIYIILLLIFAILSINFYLSREHYPVSVYMFMENPERYAGKQFTFTGVPFNLTPSSFYVYSHNPLKVYYPELDKPKFGQVYIIGKGNNDGTVNALGVHYFSYNYLKYIISFFAFILFLFIFFNEWKIQKWRFVEKNA